MKQSVHKSVLLEEIIEGLNLSSGETLLDGTFGGGGHSYEVCSQYSDVKIIAIDEDGDALDRAKSKFKELKCDLHIFKGNFRDLDKALAKFQIEEVDGVLLDLGLSSDQLEVSGRGFSFKRDEPLLMTFKEHPTKSDLTAKDIVNYWSRDNIATIIRGYGEERYARRIAGGIVEAREEKEIETTLELVDIINASVPKRYQHSKIHPATKTFQALRMAVNDELNTLELGLNHGFDALKSGGRMAVISFHSLEDRIVKNFFKAKKSLDEGKIINKKPIIASKEELEKNKRARSAKLRVIEKI